MSLKDYWHEYASAIIAVGVSVALQLTLQTWKHGVAWWIITMTICFIFQVTTDRLVARILKSMGEKI